jgi:hypothetical protein
MNNGCKLFVLLQAGRVVTREIGQIASGGVIADECFDDEIAVGENADDIAGLLAREKLWREMK